MVDIVTIGEAAAGALSLVGMEGLKKSEPFNALVKTISLWLDGIKLEGATALSELQKQAVAQAVDARSSIEKLNVRKIIEEILDDPELKSKFSALSPNIRIGPLEFVDANIEDISPSVGAIVGASIANSTIATGSQNINISELKAGDVFPPKPSRKELTAEQAFDRIASAVKLNLTQIQSNIESARKDSSQFFRLTLVFASLGFLIVMAGVILLCLNQTTAGVVAAISGSIPEVTAALFFKKDQELRKTIDEYHVHMLKSQQLLTMIDVAETINNSTEKDKLKQEIIFSTLGITRS